MSKSGPPRHQADAPVGAQHDTRGHGAAASRKVHELIAADLGLRVSSGEFAPGEPLPSERDLVDHYKASRNSVRAALLSLQSSGIISIRERSRARVTGPDNTSFFNQLSGTAQTLLARPNGVSEFQEARMLFECGLARHVARYASPKEIDRLAVALARNEKAIGDAEAFARTDVAFHDVLAEIPRNPIFTALNSALAAWLVDQRVIGLKAPVNDLMRLAYQGHERVFQAILRRDVEGADEAMLQHLREVSAYYWSAAADIKSS